MSARRTLIKQFSLVEFIFPYADFTKFQFLTLEIGEECFPHHSRPFCHSLSLLFFPARSCGVGRWKGRHQSDVTGDSQMVTMATIRHIMLLAE